MPIIALGVRPESGVRIVVPRWFACELGNVLHQRVLSGKSTSIQPIQLLRFGLGWVTVLDPDPEIAVRGMQIAPQLRQRASYDAQYVALAAQPDFPFVRRLGQPA